MIRLCHVLQVPEEPPKEETKKVGVRFAPEPEMEEIQTKTEVFLMAVERLLLINDTPCVYVP